MNADEAREMGLGGARGCMVGLLVLGVLALLIVSVVFGIRARV